MKRISLSIRALGPLLILVSLPLSVLGRVPALGQTSSASQAARLDLERLYTQPNIIGTAPTAVTWSADGRFIAFLWNERGESFRDVYRIDTSDPALTPERMTNLPRLDDAVSAEIAATSDRRVLEVRARQRRELDSGASSIEFLGSHLLFSFRGDLHAASPSGDAVVQLTDTPSAERGLQVSADERGLAFLRDGDVFVASGLSPGIGLEQLRSAVSAARRVTRLAGDATGVSQFRWSPDGRRMSIVVTDQTGVAVRSIPDYLTEETSADQVRRAYPGEEPTRQRLGLLTLDADRSQVDGAILWPRLAPAGKEKGKEKLDSLLSHRWSADGRFLAVDTSDLYVKDRRILRVTAESGEVVEWAREQNPRSVSQYFWRIEWAPDSQGLYVVSDFLGAASRAGKGVHDYHLFHLDLDGRVSQRTSGAFAVAEIEVLPQGVLLVSNRGRGEERQLDFLAHEGSGGAGKALLRVSTMPGTHQPIASPDGRLVADLFSSDSTPPDLYLIALDQKAGTEKAGTESGAMAEERLTDSPLDEFDRYLWATPRYVTFPSRVDGATLHGRLTVPPDYDPSRKYPAILGSVYTDSVRNQWGGRTAHPTWGLDQYLVQQGYVLLNVDMRGSWGRGREFREGIVLSYGGPDVEDLASGVDYLATLGFVDMERIGMWGSSYGGLMTCMSLFRHPELYAAGFAGAPATNVWHALTGQMAVMMDPADQAEAYARSSPYLHASGLEDPLMILHGMRDRVVLFKDSVRLVDHLILLGKDVDLVALPDAFHGWDLAPDAQTRFAFRKLVGFFDAHLRPADREASQ